MSPPNQLTLLRILLTPLFAVLLMADSPSAKQWSLAVFILAAITDWYDGWVARRWGLVSRWGRFFDPLADKILTSTAFVMFMFIGYAEFWMVVIIVVRDLIITFLRSYAEYHGRSIVTISSAKAKTMIQMIVIYLFLVHYIARATIPSPEIHSYLALLDRSVIYILMLITTFITAYTGVVYVIRNWGVTKDLLTSHDGTAEIE